MENSERLRKQLWEQYKNETGHSHVALANNRHQAFFSNEYVEWLVKQLESRQIGEEAEWEIFKAGIKATSDFYALDFDLRIQDKSFQENFKRRFIKIKKENPSLFVSEQREVDLTCLFDRWVGYMENETKSPRPHLNTWEWLKQQPEFQPSKQE